MQFREKWDQYTDTLLKYFGLRPYPYEARAGDPYNIYVDQDDPNDRRALRVAMFITLIFHLFLFFVTFATDAVIFLPDNIQLITLRNIAGPPSMAGGGQPKTAPKKLEVPKPKPQPLPFPDPTPDDPEPLYQPVPDATPEIIAQIGTEFSIGDISAPPGVGGLGGSKGPGVGSGPGGPGDGVYSVGGGVSAPIPVTQPLPHYTEEARKARVEGIVLLQAIIRKDGSVDSFKVIRGLGYGLDESAINTIATKWRFRPGTMNGRPVDVQANIEVTFRLY
ncbi:MAG: TonB family protein [Acidobacteria bacterium]|nr:TonB family protein [Acidobacteriota bacterium]